jgi:hypothetical protein
MPLEYLQPINRNTLWLLGVSVVQVSSNLTKREFIVSFTAIGIAFKATASSNVLNILPLVGNNSLIGKYF